MFHEKLLRYVVFWMQYQTCACAKTNGGHINIKKLKSAIKSWMPYQSSTELQGSPAAFADYAADLFCLLKQKSDFRIAIYCNLAERCLPGNMAERCGMIRGQGILPSLHRRFEAKLCYQHHPQAWQEEFKITEDGRDF